MDVTFFLKAMIDGIPLLLVVFVAVQFLKSFKKPDGSQSLDGNVLLAASMGIGLVLGVLYSIFAVRPPEGDWYDNYKYWLGAAAYGIALGGLASLFFDAIKAIVAKAIETFSKDGIDRSGQE